MALSIEHVIVTVTAKSAKGAKRTQTFSANATRARHDFIESSAAKGWKITAEFDPSTFYSQEA